MTATGNPSVVTPVLFYDFNSPPDEDGTYWCLPHAFLPVNIGDKVRFGCASDDVMADGTVIGFPASGNLVQVEFAAWVPDSLAASVPARDNQ